MNPDAPDCEAYMHSVWVKCLGLGGPGEIATRKENEGRTFQAHFRLANSMIQSYSVQKIPRGVGEHPCILP